MMDLLSHSASVLLVSVLIIWASRRRDEDSGKKIINSMLLLYWFLGITLPGLIFLKWEAGRLWPHTEQAVGAGLAATALVVMFLAAYRACKGEAANFPVWLVLLCVLLLAATTYAAGVVAVNVVYVLPVW